MNTNITKANPHNQSNIQVNNQSKRILRKDRIGNTAIWEPIGVFTKRLLFLNLWSEKFKYL